MDDISTPPELCTREDCCKPHGCICPADEPCHFDALQRLSDSRSKRRNELEMPNRGD